MSLLGSVLIELSITTFASQEVSTNPEFWHKRHQGIVEQLSALLNTLTAGPMQDGAQKACKYIFADAAPAPTPEAQQEEVWLQAPPTPEEKKIRSRRKPKAKT